MNTYHSVEREIKNEIMSTDIFIRIGSDTHSEEALHTDLQRCFELFRSFEARFSRFKTGSELSRFNDHHQEKQPVSREFLSLFEKSAEYHLFTEGLFNPTILPALEKEGYIRSKHEGFISTDSLHENDSPILSLSNIDMDEATLTIDTHGARLDFGGIGKGYIIDQVALFLRGQGYSDFFVDAGGDLYASGKNQEKKYDYWAVDIEHPKYPDQSLATLMLSDKATTTSGINRRHWINGTQVKHHIIDPRTGKSAETDLVSVTVVAHETALADVLAKSILILGRTAGHEFAVRRNIAALLADADGIVATTPELDKYLWKE
jgi:thiamine biosynthesis lipoprotein